MSITIHYIDEKFDLHARTLHVKPVRDASHTGRMVLKEFTDDLAIFNILMDSYDNITVVSDSGSNCCSADGIPSLFEWLACMNHKIATVLSTVVNKTTTTNTGVKSKPFYRHANIPDMADLFQIIDTAKKLVEWFKRTNLQSLLSQTLKQENATRWNSPLRFLSSILNMYDEVVEILKAKNKLSKFAQIPKAGLQEFVDCLHPFQEVTLALEQFKHPTMHKVIYWRHVLIRHLHPNHVVDSAAIVAMKKILLPILEDKFVLKDLTSRPPCSIPS
jgi:hypothetical protein